MKVSLQEALEIAYQHSKAGRLPQSEAICRQVLAVSPRQPSVLHLLGTIERKKGNYEASLSLLEQAIAIQPSGAKYLDLGNTHEKAGNIYSAIAAFERGRKLKPGSPAGHLDLGLALVRLGNLPAAEQAFRDAIQLRDDDLVARSALLMALSMDPHCEPAAYLTEAIRYGKAVSRQAKTYDNWLVERSEALKTPLRVGLISEDFRRHPVGYFLENLLSHSDPSRVQWIAYSSTRQEDPLTDRLKARTFAWRSIIGVDDQIAASQIHADGIHILLDLGGHTGDSRLPLFAWKPAPVQASWLGYWASTGVEQIDYLIADNRSARVTDKHGYTEALLLLPETRLCFSAPEEAPPGGAHPPPYRERGYITFGSFQRIGKIGPQVLSTWASILSRVPNSRLYIQNNEMASLEMRQALSAQLSGLGVEPARVHMAPPGKRAAYLKAYAEIDIVLDTFPFPGGTTTCEALWMGVPTLCMAGDSIITRQGAAIMSCVGLEEWVATDLGDYIERAVVQASAPDRLANLRTTLRERMLASPLMDGRRFARDFTDALYQMWTEKMRSTVAR